MSRGRHAPARHPWRRAGRTLFDIIALFVLIALSFAVYGAVLFVLTWIALKFAM